jgi:hypothetical protein
LTIYGMMFVAGEITSVGISVPFTSSKEKGKE